MYFIESECHFTCYFQVSSTNKPESCEIKVFERFEGPEGFVRDDKLNFTFLQGSGWLGNSIIDHY